MIEPHKVAAILLAAGRSTRFGDEDKLAALYDSVPIAVHAARRIVALDCRWRIAVCQPGWSLAPELMRLGFDIHTNPSPERGLSSSLAIGIAAAAATPADAALVLLADMPCVGTDHLHNLLARFHPQETSIVGSSSNGAAMPPAVFGRTHFSRLGESSGDEGGRSLLRGAMLVAGAPHELKDIDRRTDLP